MVRWITIITAAAGLAVASWAVMTADEVPPRLPPTREPSINPFGRGVAALGFAEPMGRTIEISPPEAGLVKSVQAEAGQKVRAGELLFELDTSALAAQMLEARAAVESARAEHARLKSLPRPEDVAPAAAQVAKSEAALGERREMLERVRSVLGKDGATDWDVTREQLAYDGAAAEVQRARAELLRVKAGSSAEEMAVAQAAIARAEAHAAAIDALIARLRIVAPSGGTIVRRSVEPGEYVIPDRARPALVLADLEHMNVRAQVDEEDVGAVLRAGSQVVIAARTRGSVVESFKVKLLRVEPYARPKTDLSGASTERVDTRVVDVVLTVEQGPSVQLMPGQAVDVYFDTGDVKK